VVLLVHDSTAFEVIFSTDESQAGTAFPSSNPAGNQGNFAS